MEALVLIVFCIILIGCIITGKSIVLGLLAGLILFLTFGKVKGFSVRALTVMCLSGIKTVKGILITFFLTGMLTAIWRASGCIPTIVYYASSLINPAMFVLVTFLLNALVSVLTGTAFGTAATMGVICVSIAKAMDLPVFWVGGSVLSGVYVGDRCSPVSTSALLVSTLTGTDIYTNIKNMVKTSLVPFVLTCIIYIGEGLFLDATAGVVDVKSLFREEFNISFICLLPAVALLVLALLRIDVKVLMLISIAISIPVALFVQGAQFGDVLKTLLTGYQASSAVLAGMINGGGMASMVKVAAIVCIASCYAGIFKETGLLDFMYKTINRFADKLGNYLATLLVSVPVSAIACNQTLAIMLTNQLTAYLEENKEQRAIYLEDSAVVVAPLIPWSIAGTVPLTAAGAPLICILAACYLYLLPMWRAIRNRNGAEAGLIAY